jgi:DNA-binding beta-propeller fold protein YncE
MLRGLLRCGIFLLRSGGTELLRHSPSSRVALVISFVAFALIGVLASRAREAETHPRAQVKPPLEFLGEWGTKGVGPDQLQKPLGLATDSAGSVYVADAGNGFIHKFSVSGEPLLAFGDPLLPTPFAIAVDSGAGIYASDGNNHRIFVFLPTGERLREQRRGGGASFRKVSGLAVDTDGNLFVTDIPAHQVLKFDANGRLRQMWRKKDKHSTEFESPDAVAVGPDGFVYIVDGHNACIERFTRDGQLVSVWGGGINAGPKLPQSIAVNGRFAFVTDSGTLIQVMSLDGRILHTEDLSARIQIHPPPSNLVAIALAGKDELLVLDSAGAKVLRFRINL